MKQSMDNSKQNDKSNPKIAHMLLKAVAIAAVMAFFSIVPSIVADKLSYELLKKKEFNKTTDLIENDDESEENENE